MKENLIFAVVILAVLAFACVCVAGVVYVVGEATCAERLSMVLVVSGLVHVGMWGEMRARGYELDGNRKAIRALEREMYRAKAPAKPPEPEKPAA